MRRSTSAAWSWRALGYLACVLPSLAMAAWWKASFALHAAHGCPSLKDGGACRVGIVDLGTLAGLGWWCALLWLPALLVGVWCAGQRLQRDLVRRGVHLPAVRSKDLKRRDARGATTWVVITLSGAALAWLCLGFEMPTSPAGWLLLTCPWAPALLLGDLVLGRLQGIRRRGPTTDRNEHTLHGNP